MDVGEDSAPRSRLVFDDDEEILELGSPRQPRALSSLRFAPPAVTPDPEEFARREARVCTVGDERVAVRTPAVVEEAHRVMMPEPRGLAASIVTDFKPPPLGLGVSPSLQRPPHAGEREAPAGRAPAERPKANPTPRALLHHHEPPQPQPQTPGVKRPRPRRRWMMGPARDFSENPCSTPTRPPSYSPPAREFMNTPKPLPLSRVTDDDVPWESFQQPARSDDAATPDAFFAWAPQAVDGLFQEGGSNVAEEFRVHL